MGKIVVSKHRFVVIRRKDLSSASFPSLAQPGIHFFDLDHTLINTNSSARFGVFLYKNGAIGLLKALSLYSLYLLNKYKLFPLSSLHQCSFNWIFKGKDRALFQNLVREYVKLNFSKQQNPFFYQFFEEARRTGPVMILSASPDFIVEVYAEQFGADHFFATHYNCDHKGKFSTLEKIADGEAKWNFAKQHIEKRTSYAYSDDLIDAPLLNGVDFGFLIQD